MAEGGLEDPPSGVPRAWSDARSLVAHPHFFGHLLLPFGMRAENTSCQGE